MKTMEQLLAEIGQLRATLAEHGIPAPEGSNATGWLVSAQADTATVTAELASAQAEIATLKGQLSAARKQLESTPTRADVEIIVAKAMADGIAKAGIRSTPVGAGYGESVDIVENTAKTTNLVDRFNALTTDGERAAFVKRHGQQLRQAAAAL